MFGVPEYLEPLIVPIVAHPVLVTLLTWGSLALEATLFTGLFMQESYRRVMLPLGIMFHVGIALLQGLFSFSLIMVGALVLYLRPVDEPFRWSNVAARLEAWTKLLAIRRRRLTPKLATR